MKALLTGAFQYTDEQIKEIEQLGIEIVFAENEKNINADFRDIDIVIGNSIFLYNDITQFKSLKYIQLTSAGLDRVPIDYINENNIVLNNARGVYSIPMAEWVICKILDVYKNTKFFMANQENKIWEKNRNILELNQKNVSIIGFGSVGQEIAKRLNSFGVYIISVDKEIKESQYSDESICIDNIDYALSKSDIVIVTIPLTKETINFFDRKKFDQMKDNSIFINIARGAIVNQKDLLEKIKEQKFMSVILDVFEEEPLDKNNELWNYNNVIITPHNSFVSEKNNDRMFKVIKDNLKFWKEGI